MHHDDSTNFVLSNLDNRLSRRQSSLLRQCNTIIYRAHNYSSKSEACWWEIPYLQNFMKLERSWRSIKCFKLPNNVLWKQLSTHSSTDSSRLRLARTLSKWPDLDSSSCLHCKFAWVGWTLERWVKWSKKEDGPKDDSASSQVTNLFDRGAQRYGERMQAGPYRCKIQYVGELGWGRYVPVLLRTIAKRTRLDSS
jgi:hypothetical protein